MLNFTFLGGMPNTSDILGGKQWLLGPSLRSKKNESILYPPGA